MLRRSIVGLLLLGLIAGSAGCNQAEPNWGPADEPLVSPTALAQQPQEIEEVSVEITNGKFGAGRYDVDPGVIRLHITAHGRRDSLSIDRILDPVPLPPDQSVSIDFTAPDAGQYTMRLSGDEASTAVLNVTAPGA